MEWGENYVRNYYDLVGVIDMIEASPTRYMWDDKASGYRHVSDRYLTVFKRKG